MPKKKKLKEKLEETINVWIPSKKLNRKAKVKEAIYENSIENIGSDFNVRVTPEKIVIKDEVTLLKLTPETMGEVVIEKLGDRVIISIEKEKKEA